MCDSRNESLIFLFRLAWITVWKVSVPSIVSAVLLEIMNVQIEFD